MNNIILATDGITHAANTITEKTREFAQGATDQRDKTGKKASQGISSLRKSIEGSFH